MHSHETCEQLMAAAQRTNQMGRLEYLSERCDRQHGHLTTNPPPHPNTPDDLPAERDDEEFADV